MYYCDKESYAQMYQHNTFFKDVINNDKKQKLSNIIPKQVNNTYGDE